MIKRHAESPDVLTNRAASQIRTNVKNAIMTGADLRGVDLRGVRGLTCRQVRSARTDSRTRLPVCLRLLCAFDRLTSGFVRHNGSAAVDGR
jgi:hypothetical protein